jgi:hypothetical protein
VGGGGGATTWARPCQITNEQLAFQKAICKVEIEMAMYEVEI